MGKKRFKFHWCASKGLDFIETVYELFDNPSYSIKQQSINQSINQPNWEIFTSMKIKTKLHATNLTEYVYGLSF